MVISHEWLATGFMTRMRDRIRELVSGGWEARAGEPHDNAGQLRREKLSSPSRLEIKLSKKSTNCLGRCFRLAGNEGANSRKWREIKPCDLSRTSPAD